MRVFCLFIFLASLGLSCTDSTERGAESAASVPVVEHSPDSQLKLLTDSITALQAALHEAQREQKANDSLHILLDSLILSGSKPPASEIAGNTDLLLKLKIDALLTERDSLLAANRKVLAEIGDMQSVRTSTETSSEQLNSLQQQNALLSSQLSQLEQKLASISKQKKQDSTAYLNSMASSKLQNREVSRLIQQRDSLLRATESMNRITQAYEKNIQQLRQQKRTDSIAALSAKSSLAARSGVSRNTDKEYDSLKQAYLSLSKVLTAREQSLTGLREQRKKDSLLLVERASRDNELSPQSGLPKKENDSLRSQLALQAEEPESDFADLEKPGTDMEISSGEAESDSMATVRRWATNSPAAEKSLREGFRLLLLAQQAEKSDPTLSLKLLREALRHSDDSLIVRETRRVYDSYYFYETLVTKRRPVRSVSLNETYLALNLSNDSAYLYRGMDSVLTQVQALSKVSALALPPQAYLFTGHPTGQVSMHNLTTGKLQSRFKAHDERVTAIGFIGKNETFIATGASDKLIYLWSNKFEQANRLVGLRSAVTNIDVSRSLLIAGASGDFSPRLWNTDGKLLLNLSGHKDSVYSMDISDNARYLLTASRDRTAQIWDLKGTFVRAIGNHRAALTHGIFSHSQRLVALASVDGSISLWNFNGAPLGKLTGHGQQVNQLIFDKTDTYLYSCSDDGTVRRWLIKKPKELDLSIIPPLTEKERAGLSVLK